MKPTPVNVIRTGRGGSWIGVVMHAHTAYHGPLGSSYQEIHLSLRLARRAP